MLGVHGVRVTFGDTVALDGVDLTVDDGEVVGILGPSGSGKTTLLRAVAGLEPVTAGRITRDGEDLAGVPTHRRGLGLMFQDHALFPHRNVLANVAFGLRMHGRSNRDAASGARDALALVGLSAFGHRQVHELSGGERQRVALARALAPEPRLLMLDEPLGSLDRRLREHLADELWDLFRRIGLSVLFVTHDHDEALGLSDRVAVMHGGRIEQVGPPAQLWTAPASSFVAGFLGWNLTTALGRGTVAVRPDAVAIDPHGPLSGRVLDARWHGGRIRLRVALAEPHGPDPHPPDAHQTLDVEVPAEGAPGPGEQVRLAVDPRGVLEGL